KSSKVFVLKTIFTIFHHKLAKRPSWQNHQQLKYNCQLLLPQGLVSLPAISHKAWQKQVTLKR
ncbi:MAG: hypothetical protein ACOYKH_11045, partial [Brevefilum fermentans]